MVTIDWLLYVLGYKKSLSNKRMSKLPGTFKSMLMAFSSLYLSSSGRAIRSSIRLVFFFKALANIDLGKVSNICSNLVMLLVMIRSRTVL